MGGDSESAFKNTPMHISFICHTLQTRRAALPPAIRESNETSVGYRDVIHIHITGDSRAEQNIARARACNISYVPEGASPRRTYFRIARRAHRARVLYDFSARGSR